ncbi:MAG: glutamate-5-semialdehyde dehydrogenase [Armatimonadetes bacterium]|nr:glutamate-5-semialdehyde dehydrogenase [Armatimonadota bacterium]
MSRVAQLARKAKEAARVVSDLSAKIRNEVLLTASRSLQGNTALLLSENAKDCGKARNSGISGALLDRLTLTEKRIQDMADSLVTVASLPDPLGESEGWIRPNGLEIRKTRVPLGVIAIIYEARPNVTVEASSLAFKAGNAVLLRGSSSARNSNRALVAILQEALKEHGMPPSAIQLVEDADRKGIADLLKLRDFIDVVIPRGGADLIRTVVRESSIPVIETGVGNCHIYADQEASIEKAIPIILNAKTQRPGVCNAAETLLIHEKIAEPLLRRLGPELEKRAVEIRGCDKTRKILPCKAATEEDWATEFLDLILAVRVVPSLEEAVRHIQEYGTGHSEAIITESVTRARQFQKEVDAAAVYVNASTRFTDGGEFGYGGEVGISTQKLHARGPVGLRELTTWKYVITGDGHVRE